MSMTLSKIPSIILDIIIIDSIILTKNNNSWRHINYIIKNFKLSLTLTDYVFASNIKYEYVTRKQSHKFNINDIFSTDEDGNYLDDMCEYAYW